jgi:diadenosine tetraphosphate (Ap4A) HIT family hydrolase
LPRSSTATLSSYRKHVSTIYELTVLEQEALWDLVGEVRSRLLTGLMPDGFSVGFNDLNSAADHAAVHVVTRWRGVPPELPDSIEWITDDPRVNN